MFRSQVLTSIIVAIMVSASVAGAAEDSIEIGGSVTSSLVVDATAIAGAATLDLTTNSQQIAKVADIEMSTNNAQGISLSVDSGNLVRTGDELVTPIAFQVATVTAATTAPIAAAFTAASTAPYTGGSTNAAGSTPKDLYVMYTPAALQDPGAYTATITLTFSDN